MLTYVQPLLLCMIRSATFGIRGQTWSLGNLYDLPGIKIPTCGFFCLLVTSALETLIKVKAVETDNEYLLLGPDEASVKGAEWQLSDNPDSVQVGSWHKWQPHRKWGGLCCLQSQILQLFIHMHMLFAFLGHLYS